MRSKKSTAFAIFILLLSCILAKPALAQVKEGESKHHKRIWRKWSKKSDAYNPYVSKNTNKSTHEVSRREKREDDKAIRRAKKEYKKGIRRSARKRGGK